MSDADIRDDEPGAEGDALRELTEAFGALPAPPPTRELSAEDEATRRSVDWMRAAFTAQQPRDGLQALHARRAAAQRPFAWRSLAAAALLLVLLGGPGWLALRGGRAPEPPERVPTRIAQIPAQLEPPPVAPTRLAPAPVAATPGLVAVSAHALELRSGPVHLLLVRPTPPSREDSR
jgi:hypothetical protein